MEFTYPNCVVTKIYDGDTITVDCDMGMDITRKSLKVRFAGINAPELSTQEGKNALAFLETLISVGQTLSLDSLGWDNYGNRIDGRLYRSGETVSLGTMMVNTGHAVLLGPYTP